MNQTSSPRTSGGYLYPEVPRKQVETLIHYLPPRARILDLGAGFGNNCVPLLKAGHLVTATETNPEALQYLKGLTVEYPGQLAVMEEPIQDLEETAKYDAIICTMVLQFLPPAEARKAVKVIQEATKPGGYNVIINFLVTQQLAPEFQFLLAPDELKQFYSDWEIVDYEESYPIKPLDPKKVAKSAKLTARKSL